MYLRCARVAQSEQMSTWYRYTRAAPTRLLCRDLGVSGGRRAFVLAQCDCSGLQGHTVPPAVALWQYLMGAVSEPSCCQTPRTWPGIQPQASHPTPSSRPYRLEPPHLLFGAVSSDTCCCLLQSPSLLPAFRMAFSLLLDLVCSRN